MIADLPADHPVAVQVRTEAMLHLFGDYVREGDAALQAAYPPRDPLREYLRGDISTWQLRSLVEALPPGSALHRAARENDWLDGDWINRDNNSILRLLLYTVQSALSSSKVPKPEFLPAPDAPAAEQAVEDVEAERAARARMDAIQERVFANN